MDCSGSRIETGKAFQIATEVATPEHIEMALKYKVDLLWIGARTTVNPFAVSEITEALKGYPCSWSRIQFIPN